MLQPNIGPLEIDKLFNQLQAEFQPIAQETGNRLRIRPCHLWVRDELVGGWSIRWSSARNPGVAPALPCASR